MYKNVLFYNTYIYTKSIDVFIRNRSQYWFEQCLWLEHGLCTFSDHLMLPWDSTRRTFIILLQVNPLLPGLLVLCIASNNLSHVLHVTGLSPGPWDNCVVFLFLVQDNILQPWVAHALQVVKTQSCHDNDYYGLWILLHGCQEALESFGQDAKGILDYPSGSGNTIVEDPLIYVQDSLGERLHEPWL